MKKPMRTGVLMLCSLSVAVCAEPIKVGFGVDRPPYVIEKNRSGIEVDIVTRAAALANLQVTAVFANQQRTQRMLREGEIAAQTRTQPTAENKDLFFSSPYIEYQDCAFALSARKLALPGIGALGAYSVSSFPQAHEMLGPAFQAMAAANPGYREVEDEKMRTLLLYSGRVDILVGDRLIFGYFKRKLPEVSRVSVTQPVTVYPLWSPVPFYLGFTRADLRDRFDQGMAALRQSGEYQAIVKKYTRE